MKYSFMASFAALVAGLALTQFLFAQGREEKSAGTFDAIESAL